MKKGESPLRRMMADAEGDEYRAFSSLADAQRSPNGIVVLEGDDGGQIYLVARASDVACSEATLWQLLLDIDAREWPNNDANMTRICFEERQIGEGISGGMGGGVVTEKPWVHPRLQSFYDSICAVLSGKRTRFVD